MKSDQLYQGLREIAEKLGVTVKEQNLKIAGVPVESGLCKVKGEAVFIMDKRLPAHKKGRILAACLSGMPHEEIFMAPDIRDYLEKHKPFKEKRHDATRTET